MGELTFSLKLLERRLAQGLEGAFRVQLSTKDRKQLELEVGDLCELSTSTSKNVALAFAWPSQDGATSNAAGNKRIAKVTQCLLDTYSLAQHDKVYIRKAASLPTKAKQVWVKESQQGSSSKEDEVRFAVTAALYDIKMITVGGLFDAMVTNPQTLKDQKRHFIITKIEMEEAGPDAVASTSPFSFHLSSKIHIEGSWDKSAQEPLETQQSQHIPDLPISVDSSAIGGLHKQLEQLDRHIAAVTGNARSSGIPLHLRRGGGFLLCGPQGTGKTLIINRLAEASWKKVVRIDEARLGPYSRESQKALQAAFAEARSHQPSLIIMDNLESLVGKAESDHPGVRATLITELENLQGTRVVTVAATLNPNDIHMGLRMPETLGTEIEIPVPDADSRVEILKVLLEKPVSGDDRVCSAVGERTHGYVGRDLRLLCIVALEHAAARGLATRGKEEASIMAGGQGCESAACGSLQGPSDGTSSAEHGPTLAQEGEDAGGSEASAIAGLAIADFEFALGQVRPTAMKEIFLETPKVRWIDIGGSEDVRRAFAKATERPFKRPQLIKRLDLEPPKGILMYGPPGCSKTLTAKAVATESGLNFLAVKGAELTSMYVGESERAIREVFRKARAASPSVIFFDEIDSIGAAPEQGGPSTSGLNVVTTLLNEMDGIESLKGVLVLAATNKPEILDPALMRPGRFDTHLYIGPPNERARRQIFEIRTRRMPLASDVDIDDLARRTDGYSGAEIVRICNEAAELTAADVEAEARVDHIAETDYHELTVSHHRFLAAIDTTPKQISDEMTRRYQEFRDGRVQKSQ